jgi:hypothetical protein
MGTNFLATFIGGALSGVIYTRLMGVFEGNGHPEYIMYTLAVHMVLAITAIYLFVRFLGDFKELSE